jgi:hypothetical protein
VHIELTENAVKLAMAKEDADELLHGRGASIHDNIPPSVLISTGMDLELQQ